jgi:hypothetical protein
VDPDEFTLASKREDVIYKTQSKSDTFEVIEVCLLWHLGTEKTAL